MKGTYLEVTYRRGHAVAAYYYLPRRPEERSYRARRVEPGFVIDFARAGIARHTSRDLLRSDGESAVYQRLNSFWISSNARRASMARSSAAVESWKIASCCGP